jgi:hypothetical protein
MACSAVTDIVVRESGRFSEEIFTRAFPRSPWIGLVKKDVFPEGIGEIISNLTYERSAPTTAVPTWNDVSVSDGALGGACLPTATKIGIGSTTRTWNLQRRALEGPDFCVEELRTPFQIRKQLESIIDILTDYSIIEWEIRYRHEYLRLVKRKVVVGPVLQEGEGEGFPPQCATGGLTQGVLNRYKTKLGRDGAAGSALGTRGNAPIFTLVCSEETADRLVFENADIRQDIRWGKPSMLLEPYGVERDYRGFFHLIDLYPIRYTCAAGVYTEVAAFDSAAASKGNKAIVRAAYESAPYEVSFIFDRTVFTSRIPKPITNPAPGFRFDPVNYMGEFRAVNILDRDCNPDGNIIYHRAILASGSEPVHPERGVAFVHQRCDPALNIISSCA